MGFPLQWRKWISACVSTASTSILINGSPSKPFKLQQSLRQGDPLSPFLFNLVIESLNQVMCKAISLNMWNGIVIGKAGLKISHLQYADDTIIFCNQDLDSLKNIRKVLILFQLASGLQVNFHKSSLFCLNEPQNWLQQAARVLLCKPGSLPFTYLGLPIGGISSRIKLWEPIIAKMVKKLASWKGSLLSIGGRLTLIKASFSSLPLYYMSIYPIPKGVIEKIVSIQRNFFWSGSLEKKNLPPAAWSDIQKSKEEVGLGVGNLRHQNLALLFKWLWRFSSEPDSLWRLVIADKYGYEPFFSPADVSIPRRGGPWKALCTALVKDKNAYGLISSCIRKRIGDGENTQFWHDIWVGEIALKNLCPRLFRLSTTPNGPVSSFGFWQGHNWEWTLSWTRILRPMDLCEWNNLVSILNRVTFDPFNPDSFVWTPSKNEDFSVKSFKTKMSLASPNPHLSPLRTLWKKLVPHRVEIFTWLAVLGKLNTRVKLVKLQIIPESEISCVLCGESPECSNHLFLHCSFSCEIWQWWLKIWEVAWVFPSDLRNAFIQWKSPLSNSFFKRVWAAIFFIILWSLWKERNSRIFHQMSMTTKQIEDLILLRIGWWIKG